MQDRFLSSEEYDERAHTLYDNGDYDGALETLKEGLALYPNAVELYAGLGHARLAREEFAWARLAFEQALVLDSAHEDAMVGLGEVFLRLGREAEAIALFEEVQDRGFTDDIDLMLTMARALFREALVDRARDVFMRLSAARPESAEAVAGVAYCLHRLGDEVEASRHLRRALRLDPELHEARTYIGHILYERGDGRGALRELEQVPPADQWDPLAVWRLLELKRTVQGIATNDTRLDAWTARLDQLESTDSDPLDRLLDEVAGEFADRHSWTPRDENQLELFELSDGESHDVKVRLPGGEVVRGTWHDAVRRFAAHTGYGHETTSDFMRRMAERWREQYGVQVPCTDPEGFLRAAAGFGLLRLMGREEEVD